MRPSNGPAVGLLKVPPRDLVMRLRLYIATGRLWARNGTAMGLQSARHEICNEVLQWELLNPRHFLQWSCNEPAVGLQWLFDVPAMGFSHDSLSNWAGLVGPIAGPLQAHCRNGSARTSSHPGNPLQNSQRPIGAQLQAHCKPIASPLQAHCRDHSGRSTGPLRSPNHGKLHGRPATTPLQIIVFLASFADHGYQSIHHPNAKLLTAC